MKHILSNKSWKLTIVLVIVCCLVSSGIAQISIKTGKSINLALSNKNINHLGNNNYSQIGYVPGEIIVKFREDSNVCVSKDELGFVKTNLQSVDTLNRKYQVESLEQAFPGDPSPSLYTLYKVTFPNKFDVLSCVNDYTKDPNIEFAETNKLGHICAVYPNDIYFPLQWNLDQPNGHDIDAPEAWSIEQGNPNTIIAILDTGIDYNHPDLHNNILYYPNGTVHGYDFVNNDGDPIDDNGHGTSCAGIADAVTNNTIGIAGVCWNCKIMPVKVSNAGGTLEYFNIARGIYYAYQNGAKVISMSFGGLESSNILKIAIDSAYDAGVILVAACGNENFKYCDYPAHYSNVISVAATNANDESSPIGTNYGSWIDVAAPGDNIFSTTPTYHVPGYTENYSYSSGTSNACPQVAGLAALIVSQNPDLNPDEVRTIIHSTTDSVNSAKYIGTGRINAYKALSLNTDLVAKLDSNLDEKMIGRCVLDIIGTADGTGFLNYTLYYGTGIYPNTWSLLWLSQSSVENALLGTWNTSSIVDAGYYTIKLVVTSQNVNVIDYTLIYIDPFLKENWPKYLYAGMIYASPVSYNFNNDKSAEFIVTTCDPENFNNAGRIYFINSDGTIGWSYSTGGWFAKTPAIGDINEDGNAEIILTCGKPGHLYVLNKYGSLLWEKSSLTDDTTSPVLGDIDGDGQLEIIVGVKYGQLYAWNSDGSNVPGWPIQLNSDEEGRCSNPVVADLNHDGKLEVIVNTEDGHTYAIKNDGSILWNSNLFNAGLTSNILITPAIGDFAGDGNLEIVRDNSPNGKLWLLNGETGEPCDNWPQSITTGGIGNFALGDIDSDGHPEIITGRSTHLYAFNGDGTQVTNWPIYTGDDNTVNFCTIADVNGDGSPEIIGRDDHCNIRMFESSGSEVLNGIWPHYVQNWLPLYPTFAPPGGSLIGDFEGDGETEIIAVSNCNCTYMWSSGGTYNQDKIEWQMFQHDPQLTGYYLPPSNDPPNKPSTPIQVTIGDDPIGKKYHFSTSTTDPNNDQIYYTWDWGDGTFSGWQGPYSSGDTCEIDHTFVWGTRSPDIIVRAKDVYGTMSAWSDPLHITPVTQLFGYPAISEGVQSLQGQISGTNFIISAESTADFIGAYLQPNPSVASKVRCMIYGNSYSGSVLIGTTEEKIINAGNEKTWVIFNFSEKPTLKANTEYTLVSWSNNSCKLSYNVDSNNSFGRYKILPYGGPPPFGFTWDGNQPRLYSIFCGYSTIPKITNLSASPDPIGFGFNTTIFAHVEHYEIPINIVNVSIRYPNNNTWNYTMTQIDNNAFRYILNDSWFAGRYNYSIWARDDLGANSSSKNHSFNITAQATISISTLKDSYTGNQYINITDPPNPSQNLTVIGRGLTWDTYYNASSGCNILESYQGPVNYQEDNGSWTPINNTLFALTSNHPAYNYGYRTGNTHGLFGVYFKPDISSNWPIAFTYNRSNDPTINVVRSKLVGVGYVDPQSNWAYHYLQGVQSNQGQTNGNTVTYSGAFTGTDVSWSYGNTELKEKITMSNTTKALLQNHPPHLYGLQDASSYLVFITKLEYQNLNLCNGSGILVGNVTISDTGFDLRDALGCFKCGLPLGDAWEYGNESLRQKLTYRIIHLNGETYLFSGLKVSTLSTMTFPVVIDPTMTVYSTSSDGYISNSGNNYNTVRTSTTGTVDSSGTYISIGQKRVSGPTYSVYRGFVFFNTSSLPSNAYIDTATLSLYKKDDFSTTDFDITVQNGQPTYPHDAMQSSDYNKNYYIGNGGSLNTAQFSSGYNDIKMTNLNWITKGGTTKLCLRSSRDINGNTPTGNEYVNVYSDEFLGMCGPKLVVIYRNQSKIKDTGSTNIKGYLLIQILFYSTQQGKWLVDKDTINETSPRTINSGSQLALDSIFNGHVRASDLTHGTGTYRVYTAFRDPSGNILKTSSGVELKACWQFTKT